MFYQHSLLLPPRASALFSTGSPVPDVHIDARKVQERRGKARQLLGLGNLFIKASVISLSLKKFSLAANVIAALTSSVLSLPLCICKSTNPHRKEILALIQTAV